MTLILTALCKNGITICADKRSIRRYDDGSIKYQDNYNKIFQFKEIKLVICNHGVNEMQEKSWEMLCSTYEKSDRWREKNFLEIIKDFKNFVENNVRKQLEDNFRNKRSDATATGFVICGKTKLDRKFTIYELFWSFNLSGLHFKSKPYVGLVRSGVGSKYLDAHLMQFKYIDTKDYWLRKNTVQAGEELKKIFFVAVAVKNNLGEREISEEYNIIQVEG